MRSDLDRLCYTLGITADSQYGGEAPEHFAGSNPWRVTLRFEGRRLTVPFYTGSAITRDPGAADVLSCIVSDARCGEESFESFCSDLGYDVDSRKAEQTWRACCKMGPKVRRFLGAAFDDVANAKH